MDDCACRAAVRVPTPGRFFLSDHHHLRRQGMMPSKKPIPPNDATLPDVPAVSADALQSLRGRAKASLKSARDLALELEERVTTELDDLSTQLASELAEELAEELAQQREQITSEVTNHLDTAQQDLLDQQAEWEQVRTQIEAELAKSEHELTTEAERLEKLAIETQQQVAELAKQRLELEELSAESTTEQNDRLEKLETELAESLELLASAEADWQTEREQLLADKQTLIDSLAEAIERHEASQLEQQTEAEQNESELRNKFDMAIADLQTHRQRVDELEQELSKRPESPEVDSAELAHLRAERDDLTAQIRDLETQLKNRPKVDSETANEEIADLHRRFEMAVEDVRHLKTENAELQEQLAQVATTVETAGGLDWESQKRRLLASLESEGTAADNERAEEQATIEGTIRITDEVIADKDRQLQFLREQVAHLGSREDSTEQTVDGEQTINAGSPINLCDDERLEAERTRLEELQKELQDKLRTAELELSVERAKIAREKSRLAEDRLEVDTLRDALPVRDMSQAADEKPHRRWLDKLGLGGQD